MEETLTQEEVKKKVTLEEALTILENNFRYKFGTKISYEDVFGVCQDITTILNSLEEHKQLVGNLSINRFIPLLDLIITIDNNTVRMVEYDKMLKNAYKLSARVSLEHYFIYREWDLPYNEKFYAPRTSFIRGYIYYLQEMTLNPKFEQLIAQMPSGFGKTFPAKISEAWDFGVTRDRSILALCSNDDVVKMGSRTVRDEMKSEAFGEVFPHLKWEESDKKYFERETDGLWKLRGAKLGASYIAKTTSSNVVGTRASSRIHIDDLYPDHYEALNQQINVQFFNNYLTVWLKRFVQNKTTKSVITGTLWASGDFIDRVTLDAKKKHKFNPHPTFPYTMVNEKGTIAIVQVPALDYETGESVAPDLRSTYDILQEKDSMEEYLFQTNFQQIPTDPEALFFSYNSLRTYETVPRQEELRSYAVIDATRQSGKDFFSMPIFTKIPNGQVFDYHLTDALFTKTATKDLYNEIIEKILEHHIVELVIESNVAQELANNLNKTLESKGISWCQIREKYQRTNKKVRIEEQKGLIRRVMVFPKRDMYGINTDIGQLMNNLTLYNNEGTNANDDAPDSLALFCSEIIEENSSVAAIKAIPFIRQYV